MKKTVYFLTLISVIFMCSDVFASWTEQTRDTSGIEITVSTITTRVRQIIDDPWSDNGTVRYSSDTIRTLIDLGHKAVCIQTRALTTWATMQLTADTTEYALPDNCLFIERVTIDIFEGDGPTYLPQKNVWKMDMKNEAWAIDTSTPTAFYLRNRYIGFYPFPEYSGAEITIWYVKYPETLDDSSDKIFDGITVLQPYWEILVIYAAAKIVLMEGNQALYSVLAEEYKGTLEEIMSYLRYNPSYTPENVMD